MGYIGRLRFSETFSARAHWERGRLRLPAEDVHVRQQKRNNLVRCASGVVLPNKIQPSLFLGGQWRGWRGAQNRPRRQPERLQLETQRRWFVVERQLDESEQQVESRQWVRLPSPKVFSFRAKWRGFSFRDYSSFSSNRRTSCRFPPAWKQYPRTVCPKWVSLPMP